MRKESIFSVLGVLAMTSALVLATSVRTVNLPDMVGLADRVFWGKCLEVREGEQVMAGLPTVEYTFQVVEAIKGVRAGEVIVFRQVASGRSGFPGVPGVPAYQPGEEILLFLHPDSRLGLTSPVGLLQGVFQLQKLPDGEWGVMNGLQNENLRAELEADRVQSLQLTSQDLAWLQRGRPIPLKVFKELVEKIERHQPGGERKSIQ